MKTTKKFSQHNRYSGRDLNSRPTKYEANVIHKTATVGMMRLEILRLLQLSYYS